MIADSLSLFGFDLFGFRRRIDTQPKTQGVTRDKIPARQERSDDAADLSGPQPSENFFWGIHPFY